MKRLLIFIVAAVMMITPCLSSCNNNPGNNPEDSVPQGGETTPSPSETTETPETTKIPETTTEAEPEPTTAPETEVNPDVKKIAVIAGGGAGHKIYSTIVSLAEKKDPKVIVLCTAGKDTVYNVNSYIATFRPFTKNVEAITLCTKLYDPKELHDKIVNADIICVGGGQSEFMYDTWVKFKVDEYLKEAYNNGVICCGGSAGGMCWTYAGWNDFYMLPESEYKFFYGLDLIHVYYGPHFTSSAEWGLFDKNIKEIKNPKYDTGYAMENGTAIIFINGEPTKAVYEDGARLIFEYKFVNGQWKRSMYK